MTLDRFYPIFEDSGWLARMLPLGVRLVQLRIKDRPAYVIAREIGVGKRLCANHGAVLVVNDHWREAIDTGCEFVHLGQEDLDAADVGAIRKAGIRLGISTHDEAELDRALSLDPDYVALGPVYPTILKKMKWHRQGLGRLAQWKKRVGDPAAGGNRRHDRRTRPGRIRGRCERDLGGHGHHAERGPRRQGQGMDRSDSLIRHARRTVLAEAMPGVVPARRAPEQGPAPRGTAARALCSRCSPETDPMARGGGHSDD